MAAAKCRNRRRELTDTLQAVSKRSCFHLRPLFVCLPTWMLTDVDLSIGDGQAGRGKSRSGDGNSQPAQREGAAGVHPRHTQAHVPDVRGAGIDFPWAGWDNAESRRRQASRGWCPGSTFAPGHGNPQRSVHGHLWELQYTVVRQCWSKHLRSGTLAGHKGGAIGKHAAQFGGENLFGDGSLRARHRPERLPRGLGLGDPVQVRFWRPGAPQHSGGDPHPHLQQLPVRVHVLLCRAGLFGRGIRWPQRPRGQIWISRHPQLPDSPGLIIRRTGELTDTKTHTTAHGNAKQAYEIYSCAAKWEMKLQAWLSQEGGRITFVNACRINTTKKTTDKASICDLLLDLRCDVDVKVAVWFVFCCA